MLTWILRYKFFAADSWRSGSATGLDPEEAAYNFALSLIERSGLLDADGLKLEILVGGKKICLRGYDAGGSREDGCGFSFDFEEEDLAE